MATATTSTPWAHGVDGTADEALLAGCASTYQSLRCALALAAWAGESQPEWELAGGRLAHIVAAHPEAFARKARFSMDWYYPILGGAVRGAAAAPRLCERWSDFVVPGLKVRERPTLGHRSGDVRARASSRRDRRGRSRARPTRRYAAPPRERRFMLDWLRLRGRRTLAGRAVDVDCRSGCPRRRRALYHDRCQRHLPRRGPADRLRLPRAGLRMRTGEPHPPVAGFVSTTSAEWRKLQAGCLRPPSESTRRISMKPSSSART